MKVKQTATHQILTVNNLLHRRTEMCACARLLSSLSTDMKKSEICAISCSNFLPHNTLVKHGIRTSVTSHCSIGMAEWLNLVFGTDYHQLIVQNCIVGEFRYIQNNGTSCWNLVTNSELS